jgi:hypothetical protein
VAVVEASPIETPASTRAISRPGRLFHVRKTIALTIVKPAAVMRRRRRPYQSERWPARNRAPMTPIA